MSGCFTGNVKEFTEKLKCTYKTTDRHYQEYMAMVAFIKKMQDIKAKHKEE